MPHEEICPFKTTLCLRSVKDTPMDNTPSNTTQVLTKSIYIEIWVIGTLNEVFIRASNN